MFDCLTSAGMKKTGLKRLILGTLLAILAAIAVVPEASALSVSDIESMSAQGMGDDVLIQIISLTSDLPPFSKEDYAHMRAAGVSAKVIAALAKRRHALQNAEPVEQTAPGLEIGRTSTLPETTDGSLEDGASDVLEADGPSAAPDSPNAVQDASDGHFGDIVSDVSASEREVILAPVENSNLPLIMRKFFAETYDAYLVQAEVSRRYAALQSATADEIAHDSELPRIAAYRALIQTDARAALGACLSLQADVRPMPKSLAAAALNQCIGEALHALGIYAMGAAYLDLALQAPAPVEDYSDTFRKFLDASHRTEYLSSNPFPIKARASLIEDGDKNAFHYFVAYSFVHGAQPDPELARKTIRQITPGDIYHVRGQILLASLDLRAPDYKFKSAAEALQKALSTVTALKGDEPRRLENLIWLTLGRIAYENHAYAEADAFYRRVDVTSHQFVEAIVENAWNRLFAGHPEETLSLTHALRAPRFENTWLPDVLLLEAAAYLKLCRYDQAAQALDALKVRYLDTATEIARFAANVPQRDYYNQVMIHARHAAETQMPARLFDRIVSDYGFYSLHTSLQTLTQESRTLSDQLGGGLSGMDILRKAYEDAILTRQQAMGVRIAGIMEDARAKLHALDITATQMSIDIRLAKRAREAACLKIVASGGVCQQESSSEGAPAYSKRDADAFWTFEGEFWRDELLYYQSGLTRLCE